jgi:ADP-ribose pyrophosphatase
MKESAPASRRPIYQGRVVDLGLERAQLPNGVEIDLEIIRHPGAGAIVPLHADGSVTLVHQHRHAAGGMIYEVPAGLLEPGEAPELCARRELAEEVQLQATELVHLSTIHTTPGFIDERIHIYLATGLSVADASPDADEYIEIIRIPLDEALAWIRTGRITDAKTICALHLAAAHLRGDP